MEFGEVLPFLQENHLAVVTTVGASGKVQSTVVTSGVSEGNVLFISRERTMKVKNVRRSGRCSVTVLKPDTTRYVTVEGPATAHGWFNTEPTELLALLRSAYASAARPPDSWKDFDGSMREERRTVILVTPERVYGSI